MVDVVTIVNIEDAITANLLKQSLEAKGIMAFLDPRDDCSYCIVLHRCSQTRSL